MKKPVKISLIVLSVIVGLIILLFAYLLLFFDVNNYKETIQSSVLEHTGRELQINGEMQLSVFPWLGLEVNDLALGNADGFEEPHMARFEKALFKVKLLPLLKKDFHVGTLQLKNFTINLAKNTSGVTNWQDLVHSRKDPAGPQNGSTPSKAGPLELTGLTIERIQLLGGALLWQDQTRNSTSRLRNFEFELGPVQLQAPFPFEFSGVLSSDQPQIERAEVQGSGKTALDLDKQMVTFTGLQLKAAARGADLPGKQIDLELSGDARLDHAKQTLDLKPFKASAYNLTLEGECSASQILEKSPQLQGQLTMKPFNPRKLMDALQLPPLQTQDPEALTSLAARIQFTASPDGITVSDLQSTLDDTALQGEARIAGFQAPTIGFTLDMDQIDIDRYLPPKGSDDQAGKKPKKQPKGAAVGLPLETLRALNLDGRLSIQTLTVRKMELNSVDLHLRAEDGLLHIDPLTAGLYKGRIRNTTRVDVRSQTPKIKTSNSIESVTIEPLLKDLFNKTFLTGSGGITADLDFQGLNSKDILRSLSGDLSLLFDKGAVKGVNIPALIRSANALLQGRQPEPAAEQSTGFSSFQASADLKNGLIQKSALELLSPLFSIQGQGRVNLLEKALNYDLMVNIAEDISEKHAELANLSGKSIPLKIKGDLDNPDYTLDLQSVLKDRIQKEGEKLLGKELDKLKEKLNNKTGSGQDTEQTLDPKKMLKGLFE